MAAGGEGAPLAPIYHLARAVASGLTPPSAVLNVGGVANVTLFSQRADPLAFDTGPGNGMIDLLVQARGLGRFDVDGRFAAAGRVDEAVLAGYLTHPYFSAPAPKSLDRYDFSLEPLATLGVEDACATLVALHRRGDRARAEPGAEAAAGACRCRRGTVQSGADARPGDAGAL